MLALRERGLSFSAIASRLGMRRSKDAFETFHRALDAIAGDERREAILRERERLASLEDRIRSRDAAHPERLQHRLSALDEMRHRLGNAEGDG